MKLKLTIDKKTKTILFWRKSQGSSPIRFLNETMDVIYRGELPHNFRHGNCDEFFYEQSSQSIKAWRDQNDDAQRCSLLRIKCRSLFELHRKITNARQRASDKLGYGAVFSRTLAEAKTFLAAENPVVDDYPFLQLAAETENADPLSVAKAIVLKGTEYDTLLLQIEKLRLKWSKAIDEAQEAADVSRLTASLSVSSLIS